MRLVAKHAQVGYQTPGERPGCRNCAHFEQVRHDSPVIGPRQACTKHDIEVTSGGICYDHELKRQQGESLNAFMARQRQLDLQEQVGEQPRNLLVVDEERYQARYAPGRAPRVGERLV